MSRKNKYILTIILILLITFLLPILGKTGSVLNLKSVNNNLNIEEIKFGMLEENVIKLWGTGELNTASEGGYGREYISKGIRIGFPSDIENDFYGKAGALYFTNREFSFYSIKPGDLTDNAINILKTNGFKPNKYSDKAFYRGEFHVALNGDINIESIHIWFVDKDLRDRVY